MLPSRPLPKRLETASRARNCLSTFAVSLAMSLQQRVGREVDMERKGAMNSEVPILSLAQFWAVVPKTEIRRPFHHFYEW